MVQTIELSMFRYLWREVVIASKYCKWTWYLWRKVNKRAISQSVCAAISYASSKNIYWHSVVKSWHPFKFLYFPSNISLTYQNWWLNPLILILLILGWCSTSCVPLAVGQQFIVHALNFFHLYSLTTLTKIDPHEPDLLTTTTTFI